MYKEAEKASTSISYLVVFFYSFIPNPTSTLTSFFKKKILLLSTITGTKKIYEKNIISRHVAFN